jgi:hypothetical protein
MGVSSFDANIWFTLFRQDNEKQASFIQGLRDIGWVIETVPSREVKRMQDTRDYRFDSRIAYSLGNACETYDRVVVVSDSYELFAPICALQDDDAEIETFLAFFPEALDGRWWRELRNNDSKLSFIDLELELNTERRLDIQPEHVEQPSEAVCNGPEN